MTDLQKKIPNCVGFIMDGNRRYAKENGLPTFSGHELGKDKLKEVVEWVGVAGIQHLIVYAFSTENWQRSKVEVEGLLNLFEQIINNFLETTDLKINVRFVGRREDFSLELQTAMQVLENRPIKEDGVFLWIALSYGGRAEILTAVNMAVTKGLPVDEKSFSALLWTKDMPDPDLIVRTGGEERLSNFLPWQSVYSELIFTPTYWPAFTKEEFNSILEIYAVRERRRGK